MNKAERTLAAAEAVRLAYQRERKYHRLEVKVESGHRNLEPFRDNLAAQLGRDR